MPDRTPDERRRRRTLADAASGWPRPCVVLYTCVPAENDPAPFTARLRDYAAARDWQPAAEIVEGSAPDTPIQERSGWRQVCSVIEAEHAEGIVMGHGGCAHEHPDRHRLAQWLGMRSTAFLVVTGGKAGAGYAA